MESWKPVFDGWYAVSNLGRVRRLISGRATRPGRLLKPYVHKSGYVLVDLRIDGKRKNVRLHRLVASAFIGPCPKGKEVNHKDGNKKHNWAGNLEYLSSSENQYHAIRMGLKPPVIGEDHYEGKLTEEIVRVIRRTSNPNQSKLAREYGVSQAMIWAVLNNRTWRHVNC